MYFNSFVFLYFFAAVYPVYLSLTHRAQTFWLLAASYVFYGWLDYRFLGLLWITTLVDYACALWLDGTASPRRRRALLLMSLAVNLGMLGYFKYAGFFVDSAAALLTKLGLPAPQPVLAVLLPAGISFYTFQSISYVVDVYRRRVPAERRLLNYALFVALFPHLVAGPITRAERLLPQIAAPRQITGERLRDGLFLILFGYLKKTVVADNLAWIVDDMRDPGSLSGGQLLVGLYALAVFLYADFAGYSDIARGLGKLLGFELPENFRRPLFAENPADFWRRWHITLSDWFRDYVFHPLVRLRRKGRRSAAWMVGCAVVTLLLCGLWHGAAWNFVVFGLYHGLLLAAYFAVRPFWRRVANRLPRRPRRLLANLLAFHAVSLAAVFFLIPQPDDWRYLVNGLRHGAYNAGAWPGLRDLLLFGGPMIALEIWQERRGELAPAQGGAGARWSVAGALFLYILLVGATETHAFVYFQF